MTASHLLAGEATSSIVGALAVLGGAYGVAAQAQPGATAR